MKSERLLVYREQVPWSILILESFLANSCYLLFVNICYWACFSSKIIFEAWPIQRSISRRLEIQFFATRFWCAVAEDVNKKFQVPQSLEEKQRMTYYFLTNFHLQCWFLSPANCLQTHFRVPQISKRSKDIECHASVRLHWSENHTSDTTVCEVFIKPGNNAC